MKVAIVCGSPSSEFLAPFDDNEWKIWVLGNRLHHYKGKRVDRVFEIHNNLSEHTHPDKYVEWLIAQNIPMVVSETFPDAHHVERFNYDESENLYGSLYLTSSPAYMISYALARGATDIGLYGVDLAIDNHEYYWQRPCVEAWIGFAKGMGVNVCIPEISPVGKCSYVEGRDWNGVKNEYGKTGGIFSQQEFINMADSHSQKIGLIDEQISQLVADKHTHNGARQAYERLAKVARASEARMDINSLSDTTIIK